VKKKRKPRLKFELIAEFEDSRRVRSEPYLVMDEALSRWHPELADVRIALAWRLEAKPDRDGRLELGRAKIASALDRTLSDQWEAVVILNRDTWESPEWRKERKLAVLDHELTHLAVVLDPDTGEPKQDGRGRPVLRMRKHDLGEFLDVVRRHGCYLRDLEQLAEAVLERRGNLFAAAVPDPEPVPKPARIGVGNPVPPPPSRNGESHDGQPTRETPLLHLLPGPKALADEAWAVLQQARLLTVGDLLDRAAATPRKVSAGEDWVDGTATVYDVLRGVEGLPFAALLRVADAVVGADLAKAAPEPKPRPARKGRKKT
jgi:hypothetical protein